MRLYRERRLPPAGAISGVEDPNRFLRNLQADSRVVQQANAQSQVEKEALRRGS